SGLGLALTMFGVMPCLRSSALSRLAFLERLSPFILVPRLSTPVQTKGCSGFGLRGAALTAARVADMAEVPSVLKNDPGDRSVTQPLLGDGTRRPLHQGEHYHAIQAFADTSSPFPRQPAPPPHTPMWERTPKAGAN